jgi:hypothetical protein
MMRNGSLAALLFALGSLVSASGAEAQERRGTWSGYVWKSPDLGQPTPPITFTALRAKWTQPPVVCTEPDARVSFWIGLDGDGTPTVEQAGTVVVCGHEVVDPFATPPRYNILYYKAFWEMYAGANSQGQEPFTVSPGDTIEALVGYANGSFVLELNDLTNGRSFSTTRTCSAAVVCKRGTAEWIVERPGGGKYPLAAYGTVEFSNIGTTPGQNVLTNENVVRSYIDMVHAGTTLSTCRSAPPAVPQPAVVTLTEAFTCSWLAAQ